jgi:hypothetical protein
MTRQVDNIVWGWGDHACAWCIYVGIFAATLMLFYLVSPFHTANWIIGFGSGLFVAWVVQGMILKKARWIIYTSAICLIIMDSYLVIILAK